MAIQYYTITVEHLARAISLYITGSTNPDEVEEYMPVAEYLITCLDDTKE